MRPSRSVLMSCGVGLLASVLASGCGDGSATFGRAAEEHQVNLFNGEDLTGWRPLNSSNNTWQAVGEVRLDPADPRRLVGLEGKGVLLNNPAGKTSNIVSEASFGDCAAHIEWLVPKESNSGVYFQGKYEIQILDSYGKPQVEFSDAGGIYAEWIDNQNVNGHAPRVNASRPPGEWQTFDAIFRAPRFDASGLKVENARFERVELNGVVVHENVELKGPTRAALPGPEKTLGPIMLQGDHGPVAFRNLRIRPLP